MNMVTLQKNSRELEVFIKKANQKLLEVEFAKIKWELAHGMGKAHTSASDFMKHIKSQIK